MIKKKVLVIDDDEGILQAFDLALTDAGYAVETSTQNGEYIQQKIEEGAPNLIILDVLLSGVDGRHMCKKLKSQKETKHVPIIMISAHPDVRETALKAGADDFLPKPFNIVDLIEKVERFIK